MNVPTPEDRYLVSLWGNYSGVTTMMGIVYLPFPYYQHVIKRITVASNAMETYELRFVDVYKTGSVSGIRVSLRLNDKFLGDFFPSASQTNFPFVTSVFCESTDWKTLRLPQTGAHEFWELVCEDGRTGYRRRCGEKGEWEAMEGEGCSCKEMVDEFGIAWKEVSGGTVIQRMCELPYQGSVVMSCGVDGTWERRSSTCEPRVCPQDEAGGVVWHATSANTTVMHRCRNGDVMSQRSCSLVGKWSRVVDFPCFCEADEAEGMAWNRTEGGKQASHPCAAGYAGKWVRACSRDGVWGAAVSQCQRVFCPAVKDRNVIYPRTPSGEVITVECPLPFRGTLERVCQLSGAWGFVKDFCEMPTCEHVAIHREKRSCVRITVDDAGESERVGVQVLPFTTEENTALIAVTPVEVCNLTTNQPYEFSVYRYEGLSLRSSCVVSNFYVKQQCESMQPPLLRGVVLNKEGLMRLSVMIEVPFCYDLLLASLLVKIACTESCQNKKPLVLSHSCKDGCLPGSFLVITSPFSLLPTSQYAIVTRPIVNASLLATPQGWSKPLLTATHTLVQSVSASASVTPKSTHSVRLAWSFTVNNMAVPCSNYFVHVFVSSPHDETLDPRYLSHVDSQPVCDDVEVCSKKSIIVPIANNGLRYVIAVEPVPLCAFNLLLKNGTTAFVVPELPTVDTTVTNYDHYANITFSHSNMDVGVNCSLLAPDSTPMRHFTLFVDYGAESFEVLYGLESASRYTVACWIRDGFVEPRLFSLVVNTVEEVPVSPSIRFVDCSLHYAKVEMVSNHDGRFDCYTALGSEDELELPEQEDDSPQEHYPFSLFYTTPQQKVTVMIPLGIAFSAEASSHVIVHCSFSPPARAKPILLKCGAPLKHGGISCGV